MADNDPNELTPEAKAEIAAAIAIVREDRMEKFLRSRFQPPKPPEGEPKDDPKTPPKEAPKSGGDNPPSNPPPKDPATKPEGEPPPVEPKKRGLWWGDSLED